MSGAKSDQGDSHMLAEMVRTDSHQLRPAAGNSPALCGGQRGQPAALPAAYAAAVRSLIAVFTKLNEQVKTLEEQVREDFGRHSDAEIYRSQPGMGAIAATSPITRASGKKKVVAARGNLPQSGVAA